jgi:hypothetical protein
LAHGEILSDLSDIVKVLEDWKMPAKKKQPSLQVLPFKEPWGSFYVRVTWSGGAFEDVGKPGEWDEAAAQHWAEGKSMDWIQQHPNSK